MKNKKCTKVGKRGNLCQSQTKNRLIYVIILAICALAYVGYNYRNPLVAHIYSRPFYAALDSLPDQQVKADYYSLLDNHELSLYLILDMDEAALYNKAAKALNINLSAFKELPKEQLWCVLVHEHAHIYGDIAISKEAAARLSLEQAAEIIFDDEYNATLQEARFAQQNNFLEQVHPKIIMAMTSLQVNIETAAAASIFRDLMDSNFKPYQPLKQYFPKIFLQKIAPQYRDKFRLSPKI